MYSRNKQLIEIVKKVSRLLVQERLQTLILEGSRPGILYHFSRSFLRKTNQLSSPNPAIRFKETEKMQQSQSRVREEFATKYPYYISTTRKYDLNFGNEVDGDSDLYPFIANIRYTLDGDKIAHRFPVIPYNYFTKPQGTRTMSGEFEERIGASRPGTILELKKYCLEVFILLTMTSKPTVKTLKSIQEIVDYFAKFGIPVRTGKFYKPYTAKSTSMESNLDSEKLELITVTPSILRDIQAGRISDLFLYDFPSDLDLTGLDFRKAKIRGNDLSGLNLQGVNFEGVNLKEVVFIGTELRGAKFQGANLEDARFKGQKNRGAELQGINFQGATLTYTRMSEAKLQGADFRGAVLYATRLADAQLQGAKLQGATLHGTGLQDAQLQGAKLQRATLLQANLQGANLTGAKLQGARLQATNLNGVTGLETCKGLDSVEYDENTIWPAGFDIKKYQKVNKKKTSSISTSSSISTN